MRRGAVHWGLLALFSDGPKYGYQLRTELDTRTGGMWALNVGQIYTTLERLHRDGLVDSVGQNDEGRTVYAMTEQGQAALAEWFATPVTNTDRSRSELAIKLAIAVTTPQADVAGIVQAQRVESMRQMRDHTDLRRRADPAKELAWILLLDHLMFALDSELRWLDHIEATVLRHRSSSGSPAPAPADRGWGAPVEAAEQPSAGGTR
ncbi:PadR family transcriptional regulator [Dactylosporangium sp. NPDC051485]|uniref:PadR family transcriptional regulator n=1 Tax=Dactylosporangium sp. NPDC051485 TaxID=3154846 RepID=UPI00343F02CF